MLQLVLDVFPVISCKHVRDVWIGMGNKNYEQVNLLVKLSNISFKLDRFWNGDEFHRVTN